ncbi:MAG TPA: hypothetical protein VIM77_07425 [Mucilaginibacter sp.]
MEFNDQELSNGEDNQAQRQENNKPNAYRVDDDDNLTEEDLQHGFPTSKNDMKKQDAPGMEGHGMGGHSFGENNLTPSGDDPANPSQTAGYTNAYFRRTQPAEEHPENNNFKDPNQLGQSNYSAAMGAEKNGRSDEDSGATTDSNGNREPFVQSQQPYQEGTADNDG